MLRSCSDSRSALTCRLVCGRQQRAQELQRQLDEVEVRQRDLELRGVAVEKAIRGEGNGELSPQIRLGTLTE